MKNHDPNSLPFKGHWQELKKRVIYALLGWLVATCICLFFAPGLLDLLVSPLQTVAGKSHRMIYTGLAEVFFTYIHLAVLAGLVIALPLFIWQLYLFVSPGLKQHETKQIMPYLVGSPLLFLLGASGCHYYLLPLVCKFFLGFEQAATSEHLGIYFEARVSEYVSLSLNLIIVFGLSFQLPLVLLFLIQLGVITPAMLAARRRIAIVVIFVLAAIITPPDVISQIGLALPLIVLYELAIIMGRKLSSKNEIK